MARSFSRLWVLVRPCSVAVLFSVAAGVGATARAQRPVPVNIESSPPGATVYLNSPESQPLGVTPITAARLPRGNHTLIFRLANHEEGRLPINVARRRETFRITLVPQARIVVTAANESALSASVRIDGQPLGNVPFERVVAPGRHLVQVSREGYVSFSQWIEVQPGQVATIPVILQREAPQTGELIVASDVSGAAVFVDGEPRGTTPAVIDGLSAGEHRVEIRAEGLPPFSQIVRIEAGRRATLNPTLRPSRPAGGTLRVLVNVPGAIVSLDGEPIGESPAVRENVPPGEHIVEASADGYQTAQQTVTIEPGAQRVVSLRLEPEQRPPGRILVNVQGPASATVTVDGTDRGAPPVVVSDASAGTHAIVVTAEGYEPYRETCTTAPGRDCVIEARMRPVGVPVQVRANARGAELYVDGELLGPVPYEGTIPVGEHRIEVRAPGYQTHVAQIRLAPGTETRVIDVVLTAEGELTEEQRAELARERQRLRHGATSHSAAPIPPDFAIVDVSVGWPWVAELRLNVGILEWVEGGFAMRTFGRLTEFEGRGKVGIRPLRQISLAVQARLGGGLGPSREPTAEERSWAMGMMRPAPENHAVNAWFLLVEALASLHFSDRGAFTLWGGGDLHTDRYDWQARDSDRLRAEPGQEIPRADLARFRFGGSLEVVLDRHWNVWGLLEGILAGDGRIVLGDIFGTGVEDTEFYARAGVTYKF
ncbi:MAG: PEGA domain-containing protein [Myxococcota bacterium]|nr:PEGA domain-containing protein [Myxococcota bacterium]MDW8361921.1 PEGA domain-containing protein [Myxococcales bacterium]